MGGPAITTKEQFDAMLDIIVCALRVPTALGGEKEIVVPCVSRPAGPRDVHLFPYVTALDLKNYSVTENSRIDFSDDLDLSNPSKPFKLDFQSDRKNLIQSGPTRNDSDKSFIFKLVPEVEVVNQPTYDDKVKEGKGDDIKKAMLTISEAKAKANGIAMVGNPLASHTAEDQAEVDPYVPYKVPYFFYNRYFWSYNARAWESDINKFKANIPLKLHPYVTQVDWEKNKASVEISFSTQLFQKGDACGYVTVDASECTNLKNNAIYAENGRPKFLYDTETEGSRAVKMTFGGQSDINLLWANTLAELPADWTGSKVKITVHGVSSFWNKFPLLGNTASTAKWYYDDEDADSEPEFLEGNSHKFPQKEGDFEIWIPCTPPRGACCTPNAADHDYGTYCSDTTREECESLQGSFNAGSNCLQYNYYGQRTTALNIVGQCPANCKRIQPQVLTGNYQEDAVGINCSPQGSYTIDQDFTQVATAYDPPGIGYPYFDFRNYLRDYGYYTPIMQSGDVDTGEPYGAISCAVGGYPMCVYHIKPKTLSDPDPCTGTMSCLRDSETVGGNISCHIIGVDCDIHRSITVTGPMGCDYSTQYAVPLSPQDGDDPYIGRYTCCKINEQWGCDASPSCACSPAYKDGEMSS